MVFMSCYNANNIAVILRYFDVTLVANIAEASLSIKQFGHCFDTALISGTKK